MDTNDIVCEDTDWINLAQEICFYLHRLYKGMNTILLFITGNFFFHFQRIS
jgi:hypothetical protein